MRPCLPGPPRSAQCSSARPPHERWGRRGSCPDGRCSSWSDLLSLWRESSLWERMISCLRLLPIFHTSVALIKSPQCFQLLKLCVWVCDLPGDIEEWKTNTVFDEDGEVVHVQHRFPADDVDRGGGVRMTIKAFNGGNVVGCTGISLCTYVWVCKSYISTLSFSAGHHPSISHRPSSSRQTPVITPGG